jgi:hypothetical protein
MMKSMDLTVGDALYLYTICSILPDSSDLLPYKESLFLWLCIEPPRHAWRRPAIQQGIDEALVLESNVLALAKPTSRTLRAFKRWFRSSAVPVLWGRDQELFEDERDLVALAPVDSDRLNEFLRNYFGWFFKVSVVLNYQKSQTETFGIGKV